MRTLVFGQHHSVPILLMALLLAVSGCDRPPIDRGLGPAEGDIAPMDWVQPDSPGEIGGAASCGDRPFVSAQTFETDERVATLLGSLSVAEKVEQMAGTQIIAELFLTPDNLVAGIRGFEFRDGPRGIREPNGTATTFPVAEARAASFDTDLEERVGEVMGVEARALGNNVVLAPTINTLRHPGWGRAQETYGEDPYLLGRMGIACVKGIQKTVPACVKHFAANNIEDTRMTNNAVVDPQTLRENYTRQFEMVVQEADVACVMGAYNKLNGAYCCENQPLLRDLLKGEWNFDGFVVSDWLATQSTVESALSGLDVEMPWRTYYDGLQLAVKGGQVPESVLDDAVTRILRIKFKFGFALLSDPWVAEPSLVESPEHVAVAREAATKGMVLLKNQGPVLPLDLDKLDKVAVVGTWADRLRLGDLGSSNAVPSYGVTPLEGIVNGVGNRAEVVSSEDASAAEGADVVVVVVALTPQDEGEAVNGGGDRDSLDLPADQVALIQQAQSRCDNVVVVIEAGSAITMESWKSQADAIVMAWYPGMEGGNALADLLLGEANFSGRLPMTWPVKLDDEPEFGNHQAETVFQYYHGYRHFDHEDIQPLFPFGFGLSYTTFELSDLIIPCHTITDQGEMTVAVTVENTGTVAGTEVVQLYVSFPETSARRPLKELKGFARVELAPGETRTVEIPLRIRDLARFDESVGDWVVDPGQVLVRVGSSAGHLPLVQPFFVGSQGVPAVED